MSSEELIVWVVVGAVAGLGLNTLMGGMRIGLGGSNIDRDRRRNDQRMGIRCVWNTIIEWSLWNDC